MDLFINEINIRSVSEKFTVEARSPDNVEARGQPAKETGCVYTCRDNTTNRVVWTLKQPWEPAAAKLGGTVGPFGSPVALYVSQSGWTVIHTARHEVGVVDLAGRVRGCVSVPGEFTREEKKNYVVMTPAGPVWSAAMRGNTTWTRPNLTA